MIPGEPGPRIVDFYRPDSDDLESWCQWLNDKGYKGFDYVPHDVMHTNWGTNRTRYQMLKDCKRNPRMVGMTSVADGINAGRQTIKVATFHCADDERGKRVELGTDGLKSYRRVWDDERKTFLDNPYKDWAEHIGSSFRYLGLAWREAKATEEPPPKKDELVLQANGNGTISGNLTVKEAVEAMVRRRRAGG